MRRDLAYENLWARASKIGHIMMLRHTVALVAHCFCGHGQRNRLAQRISRRAPGAHGRLIDNPKMQRCFHLRLPLSHSPRLPIFPLRTHPGLRPRQTGRAAVLVPTLLREWLPDSDTLVEGHLRPTRWDKTTVHAMRTALDTPGGNSEHKRLAKVVPGQGNMLIVGLHRLRPEGPVVTGFGKECLNHRDILVSKRRIEQALDLALEPAGHSNVIRIDTHHIVRHVALDEEDVSRPARGVQNTPVADPRHLRTAFLQMQADKGVFTSETDLIGISIGHRRSPSEEKQLCCNLL